MGLDGGRAAPLCSSWDGSKHEAISPIGSTGEHKDCWLLLAGGVAAGDWRPMADFWEEMGTYRCCITSQWLSTSEGKLAWRISATSCVME